MNIGLQYSDYVAFENPLDGSLVLTKNLDFETVQSFQVRIFAKDQVNNCINHKLQPQSSRGGLVCKGVFHSVNSTPSANSGSNPACGNNLHGPIYQIQVDNSFPAVLLQNTLFVVFRYDVKSCKYIKRSRLVRYEWSHD